MEYLHQLCANAQALDFSQKAQGIIQGLQFFYSLYFMVIATITFFENGGWCSMSHYNCPWTVI